MIKKLTATVLSDNKAADGLRGEWGMSVAINADGKNILLDVGASGLFAENAEKLGISMADMDTAVLSHAHYDHSRGMKKFFALNSKADFYLRETSAEDCYAKRFIFTKYIGLPRHITTQYSDRIRYAVGDTRLYDGVWLIPHHTEGLEKIGVREQMFRKTAAGWQPDDFSHEQSLVFDTVEGLVIFNSCSHGGAANIIREVSAVFPDRPIRAMIGGFHLFNKTEQEVIAFADELKKTGVGYICTGHCTKDTAYGILKETLGDRLHQLHVGMVMEF